MTRGPTSACAKARPSRPSRTAAAARPAPAATRWRWNRPAAPRRGRRRPRARAPRAARRRPAALALRPRRARARAEPPPRPESTAGRTLSVMAPLLLADVPWLLYRAFFSLPSSIVDGEGRPVNALLGTINAILSAVAASAPRAVVAGLGAKTAAEVLRRFGSLEEVLAAADAPETVIAGDLTPRLAAVLREHAEQLRIFKEVATLQRIDVVAPEDRATDFAGGARAAAELGMKRLAARHEQSSRE